MSPHLSRRVTAALLTLVPLASLAGQSRYGHVSVVPSVVATPRSGPIVLDGKLDDDAWRAAPPITEFTQLDPDEGKPATERTEVHILYDDAAIWVGARMFDALGARGVTTRLARRDAESVSDWFHVVIDAYHDHLGRAFFQVNPSGVKFDALGVGASMPDPSWDPIWEAATSVDSLGWTAELRIPLSQLRFPRDSVQTWGLQIRRFIQRRNEEDDWSFWRKTETGGPSRFGHLEGIRPASGGSRHAEAVPYLVGRSRFIRPAQRPDPFNDGSVQDARAGADLKYLLGSNLTLDVTLNPDFGQVEVDPAQINLSAVETFYPEKRPFFIEGAGVFDFGSANCFFCSNFYSLESFYSRRIGRPPQATGLAYRAGEFVDFAENSTILGAAKITGRTNGGTTIGLMNATTQRELAHVVDGSQRFNVEVEPLSNYFVGRVKRDYLHGNLVVGAIGTSVVRSLGDTALRTRLTQNAQMLGGDLLLTWRERTYSLMGSAAISRIAGDSLALRRVQLSSTHYLQRPDRGRRQGSLFFPVLDSSATSMNGAGAYLRLAKDAGRWMWEVAGNTRTSGYEVNDISFLTKTDYFWTNANLYRFWSKPTSWYRALNVIGGVSREQNFDGDRTYADAHLFVGSQTPGFWTWNTFAILNPTVMDDQLTRGGPVVERKGGGFVAANLTTDSRRDVQLQVNPSYSWNDDGGVGTNVSTTVRYRPVPNMTVTAGPSFFTSRGILQFVDSLADPTATRFYGERYVFASIAQRVLSLDTRVAVTFTPALTLEAYVQPFIASGDYFDFKEFDAPRTIAKGIFGKAHGTIDTLRDNRGVDTTYAIDPDGNGPARTFRIGNPDFNFRSLRGNAVLRWEYRPGSTLYLVWTQSRADQSPLGNFDFTRDRRALFALHPDNIFLVKVSYWLGL